MNTYVERELTKKHERGVPWCDGAVLRHARAGLRLPPDSLRELCVLCSEICFRVRPAALAFFVRG